MTYSRYNQISPLFMGNDDESAALAFDLISRFVEAIGLLSDTQQAPGLANDDVKDRLEVLSRDITFALTGKEFKKLHMAERSVGSPYDPNWNDPNWKPKKRKQHKHRRSRPRRREEIEESGL